MKCNYFVRTNNYLSDDVEYFDGPRYGANKLRKAALVLGWDPELPPDEICRRIEEIVPSKDWFIQNLKISSTFPPEIKEMISSYISYDYEGMNIRLRHAPQAEAILNDYIDKLPPIDKDIIVVRRLSRGYPIPSGPFISTGYLSTSVDYAHPRYAEPREGDRSTYMKIYVPAGTKALFGSPFEGELIFKHGVVLEVLRRYQKEINGVPMKWIGLVVH